MADGVVGSAAEFALKERLRFWFGNQKTAKERYMALDVRADKCTKCGECTPRCPYGIDIARKMAIVDYKLGENPLF
jgi:ferredoxin